MRHPIAFERVACQTFRVRLNSGGFSIIEVLITASLLPLVALAASIVTIGIGRSVNVTASQASNIALAAAIRSQIARRATCATSMSAPPNYTTGGPVTVRLNGQTLVGAGTDLPDWKLSVQSLTMRNLTIASNGAGPVIYIADLVMKARGREQTNGKTFDYREIMVGRVAMELAGGALAACYSADAKSDTTEQLRQVCTMTTSSDGVPASWNGTTCTIPDNTAPTTCGTLGGQWTGSSCAILVENASVNAGQDYGAAGGVWYPATCPGGFKPTGVFSLSGSGPSAPLYGVMSGNAAYSSWPPGFENTQFVYSGKCIR